MLATLVVLLAIWVKGGPVPSQDVTVLDWVVRWDFPLLEDSSSVLSALTSRNGWAILSAAAIGLLWLLGATRAAVGFAIIAAVVGIVAFGSNFTLGEIVGRFRPLVESSEASFPSGHVLGSTVMFDIVAWLAVYYRLSNKVLIPFLGLLLALTLAVGFSRIFEQAHWPSDVAAGYLLGGLGLLLFWPFIVYFQRISWLASPKQAAELDIVDCESCRIESSIASTVVLDPEQGAATKVYQPPGVVRVIYWLAFQARFPYEHNRAALDAATYRRKIASALTVHRFGKDLVAPVTAVNRGYGPCSFVTEFVPGKRPKTTRRQGSSSGRSSRPSRRRGFPCGRSIQGIPMHTRI
jgi:undecaprenyl-diphosphatase